MTGKVDSPKSAKPPVPDERFVASRPASSRLAPTATTRKLPQASKATLARLRVRRRVQLRSPIAARLSRRVASERPRADSRRATAANSATSSNAPALKKVSALALSPCQTAQPIRASAAAPAPGAIQCAGPRPEDLKFEI